MSKLATVKTLGASAEPPPAMQDLRRLQQAISALVKIVQSQTQSTLDVAVLVERVQPTLDQLVESQLRQQEEIAALRSRIERIVLALPAPKEAEGKRIQPRIASKEELSVLIRGQR
jgi:hypothetical protein